MRKASTAPSMNAAKTSNSSFIACSPWLIASVRSSSARRASGPARRAGGVSCWGRRPFGSMSRSRADNSSGPRHGDCDCGGIAGCEHGTSGSRAVSVREECRENFERFGTGRAPAVASRSTRPVGGTSGEPTRLRPGRARSRVRSVEVVYIRVPWTITAW